MATFEEVAASMRRASGKDALRRAREWDEQAERASRASTGDRSRWSYGRFCALSVQFAKERAELERSIAARWEEAALVEERRLAEKASAG